MAGLFTVAERRPIRPHLTISRGAEVSSIHSMTWFSLGEGTSISQECYDSPAIYMGAQGSGCFLLGQPAKRLSFASGDVLVVPAGTLCGVESDQGLIYTELVIQKEITMNNALQAGQVFCLKDLIAYETGSIVNLDIVKNDAMKMVLMAFDAGTGLTPHRAPGNAVITALEGTATIGYEGQDYTLSAGQSFRFDKNGLHSVTAQTPFKMALVLVLE